MKKHSTKDTPKQLSLLPPETVLDKLDDRVRRTVINGEQWVSALDLLQYHGNKKNPSQAWKTTIAFMQKQGANLGSPFYGLNQFVSKDGKLGKPTPIINLEGFLRFAQSTDVPEWEFIREFQAKTTADAIKTKKQRQLEHEKELIEKAWSSNHEAIERKQLQIDVIKSWQTLKSTITDMVDKPNYGQLTNVEYLNLFGATAEELRIKLNSKDIRADLATIALSTLRHAETTLNAILRMSSGNLTMQQTTAIYEHVLKPIGDTHDHICQQFGIDSVTGKPLLASKNP